MLGFIGPIPGGKHQRMVNLSTKKIIPLPAHGRKEISVGLIREIIRERAFHAKNGFCCNLLLIGIQHLLSIPQHCMKKPGGEYDQVPPRVYQAKLNSWFQKEVLMDSLRRTLPEKNHPELVREMNGRDEFFSAA